MSDTGNGGDNKPQQDEVNLETSAPVAEVENKPVTPAKRTPSKRLSAVERAQRESEELVKTLGGSLDIEGGRKTRSSTRGTPSRSKVLDTPPPTKKARATSGTPRRGRGRKLDSTVEAEAETTPEKIPSEPEPLKDEKEDVSAVDAATIEEKEKVPEVIESETNESLPAVEEKQSPAKQEDKPEAMEVDGDKQNEITTPAEPEHVTESALNSTESLDNAHEEEDKVVEDIAEKEESPNVVEEIEAPAPVVEVKEPALENKLTENSIENNVDVNNTEGNAKSLSVVEVTPPSPTPPTPPPAPPVSVAGNDHKAERNDICEPKIASPPITTNNDGATPQYCN